MDDLRKQSDKELKKIEDEIERIYKDAEGDLREKWTAYMDRAEKRVASYGKAYSDAVKSGDADAIAAAKAALNKKIESVTIRDKQFSEMVDAVTDRMANVNQLAADYVNGQMPRMYSYNYNGSLREVQKDADAAGISGIAFNMIDDATVERMQKRGEVTLPKRKIDVPKDKQWNRKAINAQIMQGIIQGESIPQMSKRLREVTDMNKNSSIRNARTLTTEAENGGRLDSMKTASDLGLEYEKTWIATHDERTRLSHALIDGESVPLDEKFSNGLQYPADPSGPPEEVYNCRCSLVRKLIGYKGHAIDDIGSYEPTYFDDVKAEAAANEETETTATVNFGNAFDALTENQREAVEEYAQRMSSETVEKFNRIFAEAEFQQGDGTYYSWTTNKITMSEEQTDGAALFHESTHYFDANQNMTITEPWKRYEYSYNEETGEETRKTVIEEHVVSENASFSEYIAHEWTYTEGFDDNSKEAEDRKTITEKLGLSGKFGNDRTPQEVEQDVKAVRAYLQEKGVSASDPDREHVGDFISAITYDACLTSLTIGGHGADYWTHGDKNRVLEITAGYNVLKSTGREDLIEIERELAPNLLELIEKKWGEIW